MAEIMQIPDCEYVISVGNTVRLGRFDGEQWRVGYGWYTYGGNRPVCGWYLINLDSLKIKPLQLTDLDDIYIIENNGYREELGMLTIRNLEFIEFQNNISLVRVQLDCDTIDDLPMADDLPIANDKTARRIHQGSTALIIKEGKVVIFTGDNKWVDVYGNVVKEA